MRHEKGLCFNCDERFTRGHHCASKLFIFIADDDELDPEIPLLEDSPSLPHDQDELPHPQISLHAISGHLAPETAYGGIYLNQEGHYFD